MDADEERLHPRLWSIVVLSLGECRLRHRLRLSSGRRRWKPTLDAR